MQVQLLARLRVPKSESLRQQHDVSEALRSSFQMLLPVRMFKITSRQGTPPVAYSSWS